jgi:hypothetical protein
MNGNQIGIKSYYYPEASESYRCYDFLKLLFASMVLFLDTFSLTIHSENNFVTRYCHYTTIGKNIYENL